MYNHYNRHNGAKCRVEVKYYVTEFAEKSYRIGGYPPHLFKEKVWVTKDQFHINVEKPVFLQQKCEKWTKKG